MSIKSDVKNVAVLGSTGTIGTLTLEVVKKYGERLKVHALAANRNVELLSSQIHEFAPVQAVVLDKELGTSLHPSYKTSICCGSHCLVDIASDPEVDIVVVAMTGTVTLDAVIAALRAGKRVALATKEILVSFGDQILKAAEDGGGEILPVDSEHNALHQCLEARNPESVRRVILTASGGPFRDRGYDGARPEDVLNHPTWNMGARITVDSATLMNKGFEVIEAHYLFGIDVDKIDVLIHPQSIVHSLAEFKDGSVIAQMAVADMRLPIAYALFYPERVEGVVPFLDLAGVGKLEFKKPDLERFPCLGLAYEAIRRGGSAPAVLQASDHEAVELFLAGKIAFEQIPDIITAAIDTHAYIAKPTIDEIRVAEEKAKKFVTDFVNKGV